MMKLAFRQKQISPVQKAPPFVCHFVFTHYLLKQRDYTLSLVLQEDVVVCVGFGDFLLGLFWGVEARVFTFQN